MIIFPPRVRLFKIFLGIILLLLVLFAWIRLFLHSERSETADGYSGQSNDVKSRLSIVVPFRDRFEELLIFVPYVSKFIKSQGITSFSINIINQSRKYRFNRGALANIGFLETANQSDCIAIHDVDLMPLNQNLSYKCPSVGLYHMSAPTYHPQYSYNSYLGGILLIANNDFQHVNGFSNRYFGWGLEDDEFYTRIKEAKLQILRPFNLDTNKTNTFLHVNHHRKRDTFKTPQQREILRKKDRKTGLRDIRYSVTSKQNLTIDGFSCFVFNVELYCDQILTPWCTSTYSQISKAQKRPE